MSFRKLLGLTALTMLLSLALGAPAQAQYEPEVGNGTVTKSQPKKGECITFSGDGFLPGTTVTITDNGANLGTATAGADGGFDFEYCASVLGVHILKGDGADNDGGTRSVVATVTVLGAGLSVTGSGTTMPALLIGVGLVATGSGALAFGLRRRRPQAA